MCTDPYTGALSVYLLCMRVIGYLPDIWYGKQERVQHEGDDKSAKSLDQIGRDTCCRGRCTIQRDLTEEISSGYEDDICDSSEDDSGVLGLGGLPQLVVDHACDECDKPLDGKCDRYIDKIPAEQICHSRSDPGCQKPPDWSEDDPGEDYNGISGMYVAACSGSWDPDRHSRDTCQCGEQCCHDDLLQIRIVVHSASLFSFRLSIIPMGWCFSLIEILYTQTGMKKRSNIYKNNQASRPG